MRTRIALAAAAAVAAGGACGGARPRPAGSAGEVALAVQGRIAGGPARFTAADLAALPRRTLRGTDPRSGRTARYEGVALQKLLGEELEIERGADVAVVRGKGGYEVAIPLSVLRQHRPVLAESVEGAPAAEPLALAWPTEEAPGLRTDPRARWWWVEGVKEVEVLSWLATYGRALRVPEGAPDEARPGAEAFQTSCMMCHRVRGTGGSRGPELTESFGDGQARERLAASVSAHAGQGEASAIAELGAAPVRQIAAFLRAVALAGAGMPQEEPPPEPPPPPPLPPPYPPGTGPLRPPGT